jgi:hypothetical protein
MANLKPARRIAAASALAALVAGAGAACATVQDEIQVYTDDINKAGEVGLELHTNYTPSGVGPSYRGEVPANHALRLTPELSYGLSRDWEAGLYLPMILDQNGDFNLAGAKLRLKWLPFQLGEDGVGWYGGANAELSRVGRRYSQSRWQSELRPIIGYKASDWHFAFNPILDWDMSDGFQSAEPTFVPSVKLMKEVAKGIALGAEYYSEMGKIGHILPWNQQDNRLYAVIDYDMQPLVFNFGVGRGLTDASDKWTVKAIIEVPLQPKANGAGK